MNLKDKIISIASSNSKTDPVDRVRLALYHATSAAEEAATEARHARLLAECAEARAVDAVDALAAVRAMLDIVPAPPTPKTPKPHHLFGVEVCDTCQGYVDPPVTIRSCDTCGCDDDDCL